MTSPLPPAARFLVDEGINGPIGAGRQALLAQREPSPRCLDVEIRLRPTRQLVEHTMLADDFHHRDINVVVPAGCSFGQGHRTAQLKTEEVAVAEYVLEDLVVTAEPTALEPRTWPQTVKLGALEKCRVFGGPQERSPVGVRTQR